MAKVEFSSHFTSVNGNQEVINGLWQKHQDKVARLGLLLSPINQISLAVYGGRAGYTLLDSLKIYMNYEKNIDEHLLVVYGLKPLYRAEDTRTESHKRIGGRFLQEFVGDLGTTIDYHFLRINSQGDHRESYYYLLVGKPISKTPTATR